MEQAIRDALGVDAQVHPVPMGLAVGSPDLRPDGDRFGCFVARDGDGRHHIEDDGIHYGVDEDGMAALPDLAGSGAYWDPEARTVRTPPMPADQVPAAVVRFMDVVRRVYRHQLAYLGTGA